MNTTSFSPAQIALLAVLPSGRTPEAADARARALGKSEMAIPPGPYCYAGATVCPYWALRADAERQSNGYCAFLGSGDLESEESGGWGLLWDQVKECGVNPDSEHDLDSEPASELEA